MKGLLLKDYYVITKQLKLFIIIIPYLALATSGSMMTIAILISAALPITAIAYDERSKWNDLASMMPYSVKEVVFCKYMLGYLCILFCTVLAFVGKMTGISLNKMPVNETIDMILYAISGGLLFIAINLPIMFKFGSEKGRIVFIIIMILLGASGPILDTVNKNMTFDVTKITPAILFGLTVILNIISVVISVYIKKSNNN